MPQQVLGHKTEVTKNNTMGVSLANKPTTKWWCIPAGGFSNNTNLVNSLLSTYSPDCEHTLLRNNTVLLNSTASLSVFHKDALAVPATYQHLPNMLAIPNGQTIATTISLCLQLNNLQQQAISVYCIPNIHNNLLAISKLCDTGCDVICDRIVLLFNMREPLSYKGGKTCNAIFGKCH